MIVPQVVPRGGGDWLQFAVLSGVLATGTALAVAGGVYGFAKQGDLADSRKRLDAVLAAEADPKEQCYAQSRDYGARGGGDIRTSAQDQVDQAKLQRTIGFVAAGVGLVAVAVGTYLLLSNDDPDRYRKATRPVMTGWTDGTAGGFSVAGRF